MASFQGQRNIDIYKAFWSKVNIKDDNNCWEYKEAKTQYGYGRFSINGKGVQAHRFAYESYNKCKIPEGKLVLHKCDNRSCCNPHHLYVGTQLDNMRDMITRKRMIKNPRKTACTKAILYAGEIWLIRKLKISILGVSTRYKFSQRRVAKMFKVDKGTIKRIWDSDEYPCKEGYYI